MSSANNRIAYLYLGLRDTEFPNFSPQFWSFRSHSIHGETLLVALANGSRSFSCLRAVISVEIDAALEAAKVLRDPDNILAQF